MVERKREEREQGERERERERERSERALYGGGDHAARRYIVKFSISHILFYTLHQHLSHLLIVNTTVLWIISSRIVTHTVSR